jgi:hypothetical protein
VAVSATRARGSAGSSGRVGRAANVRRGSHPPASRRRRGGQLAHHRRRTHRRRPATRGDEHWPWSSQLAAAFPEHGERRARDMGQVERRACARSPTSSARPTTGSGRSSRDAASGGGRSGPAAARREGDQPIQSKIVNLRRESPGLRRVSGGGRGSAVRAAPWRPRRPAGRPSWPRWGRTGRPPRSGSPQARGPGRAPPSRRPAPLPPTP